MVNKQKLIHSELIHSVANNVGLKKRDAEIAVDAVFEIIEEKLKGGDKVSIQGFGSFEPRYSAASQGQNPRTGESIQIPAKTAVIFKPSKALKDSVNK